jgi:hypothetical protein
MQYGQFFPSSLAAEGGFLMRRTLLIIVMISTRVGCLILSMFRPIYFTVSDSNIVAMYKE